jgi:RNA polymerase sigma-70 factor, ECF subfamily
MALSCEYSAVVAVLSSSDQNVRQAVDQFTPLSHQHLILAARSGCRTSFNELWDFYSRRVYRTTLSITKNAQDAEDALQDSFLLAFRALERFEGRKLQYLVDSHCN